MNKYRQRSLFGSFILFVMLYTIAETAKGGGGGALGGRNRGNRGGRLYGSRIPILIPSRNPASTGYYENKDVST